MSERSATRLSASRTRWRVGAYALAVAAVMLLWVRLARPGSEEIRFKGGPTFETYVQRSGRPVVVRDGDALAPGDRLGFVYSAAGACELWVLSIDDTGAITRYFPTDGAGARVPPAARAQLPWAIELDGHRGEERIYALFSRSPLDEERVRRALLSAFEGAKSRGIGVAGMPRVSLPVEQATIWFRKR